LAEALKKFVKDKKKLKKVQEVYKEELELSLCEVIYQNAYDGLQLQEFFGFRILAVQIRPNRHVKLILDGRHSDEDTPPGRIKYFEFQEDGSCKITNTKNKFTNLHNHNFRNFEEQTPLWKLFGLPKYYILLLY